MFAKKIYTQPIANDRVRSPPSLHGLGFLVFVMFAVALSANLVTPLLPTILNQYSLPMRLQTQHAAFLTGSYLLAMFIAAPTFGTISDRIDRRTILLSAMAVYTMSLYALSAASGLIALYASRILSGLGAGALLPVMLAHVAEYSAPEQRPRRFAWIITAMMTGSLAGPYLGGMTTQSEMWARIGASLPSNLMLAPVLAAASICSVALIGMALVFRRNTLSQPRFFGSPSVDVAIRPSALYMLSALSVVLMYAVGAFEVGLSTLARQKLQLGAAQLGMMYAECALVMLVMQALFFADPFKNFANRHLLFPAFVVTAIALVLFPLVDTHDRLAWVVALIASGAGVIAPLISYRVSVLADGQQGKNFGLQSAASYLGQALGSVGSGMLFVLSPQLPYWLAAAIMVAGAMWILFRMRPPPYVFDT